MDVENTTLMRVCEIQREEMRREGKKERKRSSQALQGETRLRKSIDEPCIPVRKHRRSRAVLNIRGGMSSHM